MTFVYDYKMNFSRKGVVKTYEAQKKSMGR